MRVKALRLHLAPPRPTSAAEQTMAIRRIGGARHASLALPVPREVDGTVFGTQQMDRIAHRGGRERSPSGRQQRKRRHESGGSPDSLPRSGQRPPVRDACPRKIHAAQPAGRNAQRPQPCHLQRPAAFAVPSWQHHGFPLRSGNAYGTITCRRRGCREWCPVKTVTFMRSRRARTSRGSCLMWV